MATVASVIGTCSLDGEASAALLYDDVTLAIVGVDFTGDSARPCEVRFTHPITAQTVTFLNSPMTVGRVVFPVLATMTQRANGRVYFPTHLQVGFLVP